MRDGISFLSKLVFGWLLWMIVFVACQMLLIGSTSGTGSWEGMTIFFGSLFMVPGLFVANCWVLPLRWSQRSSVFLAGLLLPAAMGLVEYLFLYGPRTLRGSFHAAFVSPFLWLWGAVILFFLPLLASVAYAINRRKKNG